jgi:hypothetical protein
MAVDHPFRGLIRAGVVFILLVAAVEAMIFAVRPSAIVLLPAALLGALLTLAALALVVLLAVVGRRYGERARQILAGDYLARWHYAHGEWARFVTRERAITVRVALILLPVTLGIAVAIFLVSRATHDPIIAGNLPIFLVAAASFLAGLVYALFGGRAYARRARLTGDTYISYTGVLRPDGYQPLYTMGYHLAAAQVEPGRPSSLRLTLQLGRAGKWLALIGTIPMLWDVRVPVPFGQESEAAAVAAQLLRQVAT